jgi:predicted ATPase/class 3 adenylate cyclase
MSPEGAARSEITPPAGLPTGEVTFLFTDIEGSTQRWEAHPEAMKAAVARHEQLVSAAIARHGGHVFKLLGDAFCAAFHSAPDAVAAAFDAQRSLAGEDFSGVDGLRVRMGLHTGRAEERNADYFGSTVNRVARLMSLGHGGQILLSSATQALAQRTLPFGVALLDLRTHRLKDLTEPEHVWQLTIAELPPEFPPLKSLDSQPNNLPVQRTTLVGRERDLEEVKSHLVRHRLLTLLGAGGVGKTRLALQAGADLLDRYPDGVWFADFAPISDPELVASVIANVAGVPLREGQRLDEAIPQWLKHRHTLLILDNCEHVLKTVARVADAVLATAPDVRMLATSRQTLGISGEQVFRLPSLRVPDDVAGLTAAAAMESGAIALFVDRARAIDDSFALTDDTAPIVADVCRRLDGIPLAIELAAARVKVLSIPHLAQRLNDRFKILTGGSRTALPRQQTLGALIDWSFGLLTTQEQNFFDRVGIFAGGFGLDAACALCGEDGLDEVDVLDLLSSLADKSLIVADTAGERARYRLLETTRAYALEKLAADGERERLARRHAEYFHDHAEANYQKPYSASTPGTVADMELELDNCRAALDWALKDGHDVALGAELAGALGRIWWDRGLEAEGRYWVDRALWGLDESAHAKEAARLWRSRAAFSFANRRRECAQHALALYQSIGDANGEAASLNLSAWGLFEMGRLEEAQDTYLRALAAMRECGNKFGEAGVLSRLGINCANLGDFASGRNFLALALAAFKSIGALDGQSAVLLNTGEVEFFEGRYAHAVRAAEEALEINRIVKNPFSLAVNYGNLAAYRIALGDCDGAREATRESLRSAQKTQNPLHIAWALQHLALLAVLRGEARVACGLGGFVAARFRDLGYVLEPTEKWSSEKLKAALREQLSEVESASLAAEGAGWSEDRAVKEGLKI